MKRLFVIVAAILLMACLDKIAEGQQCIPGPNGTCQVPQNTGWRASAQRTNSAPFLGRLVPVRPFIRPVQPVQPRAQINVQPAVPQVNVLPDPAVGAALNRIAENTAPPPLPEKAKESGTNPLVVVLCAIGAAVVGFVLYYGVGKG